MIDKEDKTNDKKSNMKIEEFTASYLKRDLLRFTTAGSVDDGKSTLIGRLLHDSKSIFEDQLAVLEHDSRLRGEKGINLALLTDGLRAEREQGITIDVAYRYFSTPKRKFIIADTPGHIQYTRNMVTGASTSDLALLLIDANNGVLSQSKRHGIIASLLGIPHLAVVVNKMDLVGYSQEVFENIAAEYTAFSEKLEIHDITFIPVSALHGDNVVTKSGKMPWYEGNTVMRHLETVVISPDRNLIDFRFPVQYVVQVPGNGRGYAGRILSGTVKTGENIIVLPSGVSSSIEQIYSDDQKQKYAEEGQSVVIGLADEIDVSRGDMIVRKNNVPVIDNKMEAIICWMDDRNQLSVRGHYLLRHTTRETRAFIRDLRYRIDVNTLHRETAATLSLNEIGRVEIETTAPLFFDPYHVNRGSGSFILIDPVSNNTVAAGMVRSEGRESSGYEKAKTSHSPNVRWERHEIGKKEREQRQDHAAHVLWFTGLSGSGKSSLCRELERILFKEGRQVYILDGDNIRHGLNGDLGFSAEDRKENIRRIGHVAKLFYDAGFIVMCAFISPAAEMRRYVRELFPSGGFSEVYIKCDIEECKRRDPKGLYGKALKGEISEFTGVSAPYEEPKKPELLIDTAASAVHESIGALLSYLEPLLRLDKNGAADGE